MHSTEVERARAKMVLSRNDVFGPIDEAGNELQLLGGRRIRAHIVYTRYQTFVAVTHDGRVQISGLTDEQVESGLTSVLSDISSLTHCKDDDMGNTLLRQCLG